MRTSLAIVLALLFAVGGTAEAKKKRHSSRHKSHKSHHSEQVSRAKRNMPDGWTWPPSRAMKKNGDACLADLDALGIKWEKGKRTRKIATPVVVKDMVFGGIKFQPTFRPPPHTMDCHLALGLERYGQQLYALGVRTVKFSSIYRYDTVTVFGHKRNTLSRHALGLAVDIKSFVDAAGNEAVVLDDYPDGNELLLNIEQLLNDSGGFRTVLTPRNDPASHSDHFHVEVKVDFTVPAERQKPTS